MGTARESLGITSVTAKWVAPVALLLAAGLLNPPCSAEEKPRQVKLAGEYILYLQPSWLADRRDGKVGDVWLAKTATEGSWTSFERLVKDVEECGVHGAIIYGKAADGFFFFDTRTPTTQARDAVRSGLSNEQWLDMLEAASVPQPPAMAEPERIAATRPHQELYPSEYRYGARLGIPDDRLAMHGLQIACALAFVAGAVCKNLRTSTRIAWSLTFLVILITFQVFHWDESLPLILGGSLVSTIYTSLVWGALWLGRKVAGRLPKPAPTTS